MMHHEMNLLGERMSWTREFQGNDDAQSTGYGSESAFGAAAIDVHSAKYSARHSTQSRASTSVPSDESPQRDPFRPGTRGHSAGNPMRPAANV